MAKRYTHKDIDLTGKNVAVLIQRKLDITDAMTFAREQSELYTKESARLYRLLVKNNEALERFTDRYEAKA